MFNKTLIAAAAGLIATGSLATATAASAAGPSGHGFQQGRGPAYGQNFGGVYFGGPGWSITVGTPRYAPPRYAPPRYPPPRYARPRHAPPRYAAPAFRPQPVCRPVFKQVTWWRHGRLHTRVVKVGQKCRSVSRQYRPRPGWGPVWGQGRGRGWGQGWGYAW